MSWFLIIVCCDDLDGIENHVLLMPVLDATVGYNYLR